MLTSSLWPGVLFWCLRSIVRCFQCFVRGSSPSGKVVSHEPPLPLGNNCLGTPPPSPSEFPMILCGGGGGYGYFLEPHNANTAGHSCLGNEIKYSFYYLLSRSLHSSVCVMISFTMTIHPCIVLPKF